MPTVFFPSGRRHFSSTPSLPSSKTNVVVEKIVSAANGILFRVTVRNPEAPHAVLCLPGALGTGPSDFANLLYDDDNGLGPEFGIYALDPRGLGGSTHDVSGNTIQRDFPMDFYLRDGLDAAEVMAGLGFETYSVLGWSDGANAAVHLAAHPSTKDRVQNLVIWGGGSYVTEEDVEAWESLRDIRAWSPRAREQKAAVHGDYLQELNHAATDGWVRLYHDARGDVCLSVLHKVECPTLVLHGSKDVICGMDHARYLARQIPDATLTIFPEGKHNLHQKDANDFARLVRGFLTDETTAVSTRSQPTIDEIAYGFMGSKALSVALKIGVFDAIDASIRETAKPAATLEEIRSHCHDDIPEERLRTLLSACVALRLIDRRVVRGIEVYSLPEASADQLVKTSKRYWGDYIVGQVDAQFYTRMKDLDTTILTGDSQSDGYEAWFESDPEAAQKYTQAQHNGSLATGYGLLRRLPELTGKPNLKMLDVGGGSGAFSIAVARKVHDASCVVLDLPNVVAVAKEIISDETDNVKDRLSTLALSATAPDQWTGIVEDETFDVVLMSYVSGSIPAGALKGLYKNAYRALKPGGIVVVHDFFVDNDGNGPQNAALWALAHVTVNPEGMGLRPGRVTELLLGEGFVSPKVGDMIPDTTQLLVATKPGG